MDQLLEVILFGNLRQALTYAILQSLLCATECRAALSSGAQANAASKTAEADAVWSTEQHLELILLKVGKAGIDLCQGKDSCTACALQLHLLPHLSPKGCQLRVITAPAPCVREELLHIEGRCRNMSPYLALPQLRLVDHLPLKAGKLRMLEASAGANIRPLTAAGQAVASDNVRTSARPAPCSSISCPDWSQKLVTCGYLQHQHACGEFRCNIAGQT